MNRAPDATTEQGARLIEACFFVFVLIYASGAIIPLLSLGPPTARAGDITTAETSGLRLVWAGIYIVALVSIARHFSLFYTALRAVPLLPLLIGYLLVSALWSDDALMSLQHGATFAMCAAIGLLLGGRFPVDSLLRLIAIALAVSLVASAFVMLALPHWGTMVAIHPGAWSGVFLHKNGLGSMALLGVLAFSYQAHESRDYVRLGWLLLIGLAAVLIIGSNSATALMGLVLALPVAFTVRLVLKGGGDQTLILAVIAALGFAAFVILMLFLGDILGLFGRDLTFTGRTQLWGLGLSSLWHSPILGYGFDAFWYNTGPHGGLQVRMITGWKVPHIHNSWLELSLQLGLLGMTLFCALFFKLFSRAWRIARQTGAQSYIFVVLFLLYVVLYSMGEHVFLVRNEIVNIILVALMASAALDFRALQPEPKGRFRIGARASAHRPY